MITSSPSTFFANGHKCEIDSVRREHYIGKIDGEQVTQGGNVSHIRETLIDDAKYRESVTPNFEDVCVAVAAFLRGQKDHDGNQQWVHQRAVKECVTPTQQTADILEYRALMALKYNEIVVNEKVYMARNAEDMWKFVADESEDLSAIEFNKAL